MRNGISLALCSGEDKGIFWAETHSSGLRRGGFVKVADDSLPIVEHGHRHAKDEEILDQLLVVGAVGAVEEVGDGRLYAHRKHEFVSGSWTDGLNMQWTNVRRRLRA